MKVLKFEQETTNLNKLKHRISRNVSLQDFTKQNPVMLFI